MGNCRHELSNLDPDSPLASLDGQSPRGVALELENELEIFYDGFMTLHEYGNFKGNERDELSHKFHPSNIRESIKNINDSIVKMNKLLSSYGVEHIRNLPPEGNELNYHELTINSKNPKYHSIRHWIRNVVRNSPIEDENNAVNSILKYSRRLDGDDKFDQGELYERIDEDWDAILLELPDITGKLFDIYQEEWFEGNEYRTGGGTPIFKLILGALMLIIISLSISIIMPLFAISVSPVYVLTPIFGYAVTYVIRVLGGSEIWEEISRYRIEKIPRKDVPGHQSDDVFVYTENKPGIGRGVEFIRKYLDWGFLDLSFISNSTTPDYIAVYEHGPADHIQYIGKVNDIFAANQVSYCGEYEEAGFEFEESDIVINLEEPLYRLEYDERIVGEEESVDELRETKIDRIRNEYKVSEL
ncbi:uncharacterized protein Nmag_0354 [Natrialba magadii ATCC 43099]|uniref:Uncharacterized protein n=1 Tax=Natrialba magadii (strain ATCC 43099 / DSM 3394 / CCM 3739 / CIP 104546 / IAM 13178 / JCM 8861 / NBRC 102185 / NCIMB 2190 / MS3) TaxID=547559 RepID=D3SXC4_NATMM|nr:hypothetical protein [Natrialba magadii]ADD03944.1 uncharacterized protein Nmag_0354 [Natrialba magadii ATCC 43099]ELY33607.1 hypothetical protein C500_02205 [Natrialba magadii ATCC 43099]